MKSFLITAAVAASFFLVASCSNPLSDSTLASQESQRALVGPTPLTYHVANTGNNNNSGTSAAPFKTIGYALSKAAAANPTAGHRVVVEVAPGTYNAQNAEIFPLILPAHVELVGDVSHSGNASVPTKIVGEGAVPDTSFIFACVVAQDDDIVAGLIVTTNNTSNSGRHFGILVSDSEAVSIAYCSIIKNETGVYVSGNSQATIHNNTVEKNNTGIWLNAVAPLDGSITEINNNSIRYNFHNGVDLTLTNGSVVPDLGGALIGTYYNPILGPMPIYGKGLNVLAWNGSQDLYVDSYVQTSQSFFLYARNNSWSKVYNGGTSGGTISIAYPTISVDSSAASQAPSTPSAF